MAAARAEIKALEKKSGLSLSTELKEGDKGIYRKMVEIVGRQYGLMEQANGEAKLIPADRLASREKGKAMVIEKQPYHQGRMQLKAVQPKERAMERGFDIGGR